MTATLAVIVQDIKAQFPDVTRIVVPFWVWDDLKAYCSRDWLKEGFLSYGGIRVEPGHVDEPTPIFEEKEP